MAKKRIQYRETTRTFRVIPFPGIVHVVITNDIYRAAEKRPNTFGDWRPDDNWNAYTASLRDGSNIVVFKYSVLPATIVHECCHVITNVFEKAGVEHPFDREVHAYHLDELFELVSAFVKEARKKKAALRQKA